MMGTWKDMTPDRRHLAERTFAALDTFDALVAGDGTAARATGRVGFSDLYAYAAGAADGDEQRVRLALTRDPALRRALDALLGRVALHHFPRAAAASSGDVESREGAGFRIRVRASRAVATQCYVIVEVDPTLSAVPTALFVKTADGAIDKHPLPAIQDGAIQILAEADSALVRALRDAGTEVFLR